MNNFFAQLKRRNVYKVAVAYIVAGWALSQGIAQVFPVFDVPNWIIRLIVLLVILGLPIALMLAWMFEITPGGLKRTEHLAPDYGPSKSRAWIYIVSWAALYRLDCSSFVAILLEMRPLGQGRTTPTQESPSPWFPFLTRTVIR